MSEQTIEPGNNEQGGFLERLRSSEGSEQVVLYRANGRQLDFLDRYAASTLAASTEADILADVKGEHGGGVYELVLLGPGGQWERRHRFSIAGLPKKPREEAAPPQGQQSELALILAKMAEDQRRSDEKFAQLLVEIRQQPQQQPANTMADTLGMVEQVASILGKTGATPAPQKGLLEQLTEVKQVMDMMGMTGGGEEKGFGWLGPVLEQYGPALLANLSSGQGATTDNGGGAATAANPQAVMLEKLQLLLLAMVEMAELEVAPDRALGQVQKKAGQLWPVLEQVIAQEDAITRAADLVPEVETHREWFEAVRGLVIGEPVAKETKPKAPARPRATSKRKAA